MDQELLQAIKIIVTEAVMASEQRMRAEIAASEERMRATIKSEIAASEERMRAEIAASEERMRAEIAASENRMKTYFENDLQKAVNVVAEGHAMLAEKIEQIDVRKELDEIKGSIAVIESAVTRNTSSIIELQKAQG